MSNELKSSNQFAFLVRELGVMAHGLAQNADDGNEHSEVKLLRAAATLLNAQQDEIERLRGKKGAHKCLRCGATSEWLE